MRSIAWRWNSFSQATSVWIFFELSMRNTVSASSFEGLINDADSAPLILLTLLSRLCEAKSSYVALSSNCLSIFSQQALILSDQVVILLGTVKTIWYNAFHVQCLGWKQVFLISVNFSTLQSVVWKELPSQLFHSKYEWHCHLFWYILWHTDKLLTHSSLKSFCGDLIFCFCSAGVLPSPLGAGVFLKLVAEVSGSSDHRRYLRRSIWWF